MRDNKLSYCVYLGCLMMIFLGMTSIILGYSSQFYTLIYVGVALIGASFIVLFINYLSVYSEMPVRPRLQARAAEAPNDPVIVIVINPHQRNRRSHFDFQSSKVFFFVIHIDKWRPLHLYLLTLN
jgi:hypothetical protein